MKTILSILLLFLSCVACAGRQNTPRNQNERLRNSTVAIVRLHVAGELSPEIEDASGEKRYLPHCTGIFVSRNLILTAAHCVDLDIPEIIVRMIRLNPEMDERLPTPIGGEVLFSTLAMYNDDAITDSRRSVIVKFDRVLDLALLSVARNERDFFREHVEIRRGLSGVQSGDPVYTMGHPGGALWTFTLGTVSAAASRDLAIVNSSNYTQVDGTIWRGNSGGGLIDENGFLIGICAMVRQDNRQSYFVKHSIILNFLNI